jgi:hypothetical protein
MPPWRLSIATATAPATPLARYRATIAAVGTLIAVLVLGQGGVPAPSLATLTYQAAWFGTAGLATVTGAGLLAHHLARLTILPRPDPLAASLLATLIATALLPGIGAPALIVPAILSLAAAWRDPGQRVVALLVQCGAALSLASGGPSTGIDGCACVIMLVAAAFAGLHSKRAAANDNPSMERNEPDSKLPPFACYANQVPIRGNWGVE